MLLCIAITNDFRLQSVFEYLVYAGFTTFWFAVLPFILLKNTTLILNCHWIWLIQWTFTMFSISMTVWMGLSSVFVHSLQWWKQSPVWCNCVCNGCSLQVILLQHCPHTSCQPRRIHTESVWIFSAGWRRDYWEIATWYVTCSYFLCLSFVSYSLQVCDAYFVCMYYVYQSFIMSIWQLKELFRSGVVRF